MARQSPIADYTCGDGTVVASVARMEIATSGALASIRSDLRRVETLLGARLHQIESRIEAGEASLRAEIQRVHHGDAARAEQVRCELCELAARLTELAAKIDRFRATVRTYEESTYDLAAD
jgi:hypothetical protein